MAESTLTNSKKLRGSIKRQLTDFENILKAIKEDTDIEALDSEGRLNKHLTYWDEFKEIQNKFDFYAISGLAKKHLKSRSIGSLSIAFTSITPPFSISSRNEDHVPRENLCRPVSRFEFPRLQTPTFHGSYDTWFNFHDSFKSMCHDNAEISTIHKFYYLKACLKDEAAEIIASLKTTNENYTVAWELLKNRYDNRRFIVESHARSLFEIPRVSREFAVRNLVDNVQKHVRALKALSQPVDTWDTLLILIVKEKLNTYTREKWEESLKGTDVPRFEDIVSFLEQRASLRVISHFKGKSILKNKLNIINKINFQEILQLNTIPNHHIYAIRQQYLIIQKLHKLLVPFVQSNTRSYRAPPFKVCHLKKGTMKLERRLSATIA